MNEQSDNGVVKGGGGGLDPEQVDTYEVAWIHAGEDWRYRLSTYRSDVKDLISIGGSVDPAFVLEYQNSVEAESYGVEIDAIYQSDVWQAYGNAAWNRSKQKIPLLDPNAFSTYPDIIVNAGLTYHLQQSVSFTINNLVYDGFKTVTPGLDVTPSYEDGGSLPTLWRTDLSVSWTPPRLPTDCEVYLTLLDVFDRQDVAASMTALEYGNSTPGLKLLAGVSVQF